MILATTNQIREVREPCKKIHCSAWALYHSPLQRPIPTIVRSYYTHHKKGARVTRHEKFSCMCSLPVESTFTLRKSMFITIQSNNCCIIRHETVWDKLLLSFRVYSQSSTRTKKETISTRVLFDQFEINLHRISAFVIILLTWDYNAIVWSLSGLTWRTAMPAAPDAVHPPHVLKYSMPPPEKDVAYSCVVTTAPIGKPFPIGFPRVTISGTTPYISNAQKWLPTLPKPTCTSSAIHAAPSSLIALYTASRYPSGRMICKQEVVRYGS